MREFTVTRIGGDCGQEGRVRVVEECGRSWEVPLVRSKTSGRLFAAQNDYESDTGVEPGWELRGDLNDAVRDFAENEPVECP